MPANDYSQFVVQLRGLRFLRVSIYILTILYFAGPVSVQVGAAIAVMLSFSAASMSVIRSEYDQHYSKILHSVSLVPETISHVICWDAEDHPELEKTRTAEWKAAAKSLPNPLRDPEGKFR